MDGQFAHPPQSFTSLAQKFVCVRVTDMQAVDLNRYTFDFDTTLAVLFAHPDGTIYHRFGGRSPTDASAYLSMPALVRVMRTSLAEHAQHASLEQKRPPSRTVYDYATFRARMDRKPKRPSCIHCHTVHEAQVRDQRARGLFRPASRWIWPSPARIGLQLDPVQQSIVVAVKKGSPADQAGLKAGDVLDQVGAQRVATVHDVQWVLHEMPATGGPLAIRFRRQSKPQTVRLSLSTGFKRTDPLTYAWRPFKWGLTPKPGFGGPELTAAEKQRLGLAPKSWAFRVQYVVNWGPEPGQGRANLRAGLRRGDVVIEYAGKNDFASMPHFHAWVRLTRKQGETVEIQALRGGERRTIRVRLQ